MRKPLELEFVLVSSGYATMNAVSGGVKKYGANFILVPTAEAARDCLNRRKIDGVSADLEVLGTLGVMESIRKGTSNSKAVIFACVADASGKRQAAWINTEGVAGIILQIFHGTAREHLESWLTTREQLGGKEKDA